MHENKCASAILLFPSFSYCTCILALFNKQILLSIGERNNDEETTYAEVWKHFNYS